MEAEDREGISEELEEVIDTLYYTLYYLLLCMHSLIYRFSLYIGSCRASSMVVKGLIVVNNRLLIDNVTFTYQ